MKVGRAGGESKSQIFDSDAPYSWQISDGNDDIPITHPVRYT